ncbi:hypothetical protein FE840_011830 [Peteryoungia desertarenae]|uniref:Uncharacterized protein n=1 Tax=Peteryoungia desertarenae TaxID=1813451 RepID=A0ABX6QPJ4_9HYPH|nr:hypothetical protein [Peteryoungia desertarenae]QLF70172.1 hypothetical protein FE840_011830 [Peteryoungia desertarenae]
MSAYLRIVLALFLVAAPRAKADDIDRLPISATFVVSGGYWIGQSTEGDDATPQRGYYKLVAIRQPDRTARLYLQMIAAGDDGLRLVESAELEEFTAIKPYVTGIRPDSMEGVAGQPGFFATVYLKTDPAQARVEEWTVLIDDLGDLRVERASN